MSHVACCWEVRWRRLTGDVDFPSPEVYARPPRPLLGRASGLKGDFFLTHSQKTDFRRSYMTAEKICSIAETTTKFHFHTWIHVKILSPILISAMIIGHPRIFFLWATGACWHSRECRMIALLIQAFKNEATRLSIR